MGHTVWSEAESVDVYDYSISAIPLFSIVIEDVEVVVAVRMR